MTILPPAATNHAPISEAASPASIPLLPLAASPARPAINEAQLRDALKRCSPDTTEAAWAFQQTGDLKFIPAIVRGVIERYMDREKRGKFGLFGDELRLSEDLGIDSLTMMEIVLLAEDVFPISIHNEELCSLRTVGDINRFIAAKLRA